MFDSLETGNAIFALGTFTGFIPYIIIFLLKSLQVSLFFVKHVNLKLYHPIFFKVGGFNSSLPFIAHVVVSFLSPFYIPFGIIMQLM